MRIFESNKYTIIKYTCANRIHVDVVTGYKNNNGLPTWDDIEISIKLSHYGSRETTQEEIENAIEISKKYIELVTNK